jgi:hypothetical protein
VNSEPQELLRKDPAEEPPPFLGSWRRVYTAVILFLLLLIVAFDLFEKAFAP